MDKKTIAAALIGAAIGAGVTYFLRPPKKGCKGKRGGGRASRRNIAFVFIKPHANNAKTQQLVSTTFKEKGIRIVEEGEYTGEQIDAGMHIDQHYYAIASKATILKPEQIPVPAEKFEAKFGQTWQSALDAGMVFNAKDACEALGVDSDGLNELWSKCDKVKFGGGFYCGVIEGASASLPKIYVFNAFFMSMRSKFVAPGTSIHYYLVEWEPSQMSWTDFRGKVLGPTNPAEAPAGSLRNMMLVDWQALGLGYEPNVGDNCVHASASPFEGLAERMNWLKVPCDKDPFGSRCLDRGIPIGTIKEWSVDPQVKGKSIFDQLEDLDVDECVEKMAELAK